MNDSILRSKTLFGCKGIWIRRYTPTICKYSKVDKYVIKIQVASESVLSTNTCDQIQISLQLKIFLSLLEYEVPLMFGISVL
jgi:hypothetical protein